MSLHVPKIPKNLELPVSSLVRAAMLFRGAVVRIGEGETVAELVAEHKELLLKAERVIDVWAAATGCDGEVEELTPSPPSSRAFADQR